MDLALIERLMALFSASDATTLEVTEGNLTIRLSKSAASAGPSSRSEGNAIMPGSQPEPVGAGPLVLRAGLSGTFYRAPSPGAAPFAEEGGLVADGDCIGLIEAMKMLNPVEVETAGRIRRFLVEDGTAVTPGTALVEFEATAP